MIDKHAVAVVKDSVVDGHIPYKLAPRVGQFLRRDVNKAFKEVTGEVVHRGAGYGQEVQMYHASIVSMDLKYTYIYMYKINEGVSRQHDCRWTYMCLAMYCNIYPGGKAREIALLRASFRRDTASISPAFLARLCRVSPLSRRISRVLSRDFVSCRL